MLATGTLVHGRYRISRPIGRGGIGAVYEAVDARLQNAVAVKQMTVEGPEADHAFEREAMLLAGLRHPALPVVIDYFADSDGLFLVMQYIEGEDLARTLERLGGACDPDEVRAWAIAVLDALAYLHEHHPPIVHRDIKPANLKRTPAGEIVLLDFGLAKGARAAMARPTDEQSLLGFTLRYAPPEQIESRGTDPRSDLYALGATLFHLLTGVQPPTALQREAARIGGRPDPLREPGSLNPRVPDDLAQAVVRAMALDPAKRFGSAAEMRAALAGERQVVRPRRTTPGDLVRVPRRVDAAMPSQAEVGRQTDLLVQVRFAGSPVLGLEDWPTRRRPPRIEQASEPLEVTHPTDPESGRPLPARLRVRVVAPDFTIEGQSELIVDVPPDDYSKRLAFLLTPTRPGYCRVNVEVHGPDAVYLGTVPVETEAVGGAVSERTLEAATLVLGVIARQVAEAVQRGETIDLAALAPLLAGQAGPGPGRAQPAEAQGPPRDDESTRPWAGPRRPSDVAAGVPREDDVDATVRLGPPGARGTAARAEAPTERDEDGWAPPAAAAAAPPLRPPTAARPVPRFPAPSPPAAAMPPAGVHVPPRGTPVTAPPSPEAAAQPAGRSWLRRAVTMTPLAAAAVITAVFVWNQRMAAPLPGPRPDTATSAPAAHPAPPIAAAPATPFPVTTPPTATAPTPPPAAAPAPLPSPGTAPPAVTAPAPPPVWPAPTQPVPPGAPDATPSPPRPGGPATIELASSTHPQLTAVATLERRSAGRVRLHLVLQNGSAGAVLVAFDRDATYVSAGGRRARVVGDSAGTTPGAAFESMLDARSSLRYWMEFEAVDSSARSVEVVLAPPGGRPAVAMFAPFSIALDAR